MKKLTEEQITEAYRLNGINSQKKYREQLGNEEYMRRKIELSKKGAEARRKAKKSIDRINEKVINEYKKIIKTE